MKFTELKESINGGAKPVYLLEGEDAYFRMKGEELIKKAFLVNPELNYSAFEGETLKGSALNSLVSALKNYPFMAEKRVVKVTEFYPSEADYAAYLQPLFEDFPPTALLLIVNSAPAGKKGADLKRKKAVTYVDCGKAEPDSVARWAYVSFKRAGIACSAETAQNLAAYCLYDMARVSTEVQKLIDYKVSGELTAEEVDALVYKDADYRIYEMTGAVARKDFTRYCTVSGELKNKGADEMTILNGLLNYFKNLLSAISSNLGDAQFAKENDMKEYAVKKNREQAAAIGAKTLERLVNLLYGAVSDIKNGTLTPASALLKCENTIFFG